eukprot:gnl/MRDRNA2_/MRDRNA2_118164_c0_seq1.p2 gnl/MRDRNA2_/MRDRNA2_118164_c0~~gnl/MRDRNA2_/MRDRNA2_118164_c0_seq1.p2  ORF type:complete len:231 (-),score=47.62 gnl/MRDRNA2_/MRDRNA2_118164_c0_seq1:14-706(-)
MQAFQKSFEGAEKEYEIVEQKLEKQVWREAEDASSPLAYQVDGLLNMYPDLRTRQGIPVSRNGLMELPGGLPEGSRIAGFVEVKSKPHHRPHRPPQQKTPKQEVEIGIGRAFDSNAPLLPSPYIPVGPLAQLGLMRNVYPTTRPPPEVFTDIYGRVVSKHPVVWHDQLDLHELGHFKRQYKPVQDDYQRKHQVYDEFQDLYSHIPHHSQKPHRRTMLDAIAPVLQKVYPP